MNRTARDFTVVTLTTAALVRTVALVLDVIKRGGSTDGIVAVFSTLVAASFVTPLLVVVAAWLLTRRSTLDPTMRSVQLVIAIGIGAVLCIGTIAYTTAYLRATDTGFFILEASTALALLLGGLAAIVAGFAALQPHPESRP